MAAAAGGSLVLAGTNDTLYRSADGGVSWTATLKPAGPVLAVAFDPVNSANAYAVGLATASLFSSRRRRSPCRKAVLNSELDLKGTVESWR